MFFAPDNYAPRFARGLIISGPVRKQKIPIMASALCITILIGSCNQSQTPAVKICLIICAIDKRARPALSRERFPLPRSLSLHFHFLALSQSVRQLVYESRRCDVR